MADDILGKTDGDEAKGSTSTDREPTKLSIIADTGDPGDASAASIGYGARVPEDLGRTRREGGTHCSHRGEETEHSRWLASPWQEQSDN